jgi:hypothetical protein
MKLPSLLQCIEEDGGCGLLFTGWYREDRGSETIVLVVTPLVIPTVRI